MVTSVGGPSGDVFLFNNLGADRKDIWQQQLGKPDTARPLVHTAAHEINAVFSPDGRWVAFESNAADRRSEIYVRGYPDGPMSLVSANGGSQPQWNPRGGGELFYQDATSVVAVRIVNGARIGPPSACSRSAVRWVLASGMWPRTASDSSFGDYASAADQGRDELDRGTQGKDARLSGRRETAVSSLATSTGSGRPPSSGCGRSR